MKKSFQWSSNTITNDIGGMLARNKQKQNSKQTNPKRFDEKELDARKLKLYPFAHHFKNPNDSYSPKYKLGDIKFWNVVTDYYL